MVAIIVSATMPGGAFEVFGATGGGGGSLILDLLATTANRAYSLRKLRTAYAGSAIKVRRSSDNTTQDIGFDGSGNLDTSALATFVSSNSAFIDTWYDQTTNADHLVQATTSKQPRIRNAGTNDTKNSLPVVFFIQANAQLMAGTTSFTAAEVAFITAVNYASPFPGYQGFVGGTAELGIVGNQSNTDYLCDASGGVNTTGAVNGAANQLAIFGGTLQQVDSFGSGATWTAPQIGSDRTLGGLSPSRYLDGWLGEIILFPTSLSSGNRTTLYTDQKTYWGTP